MKRNDKFQFYVSFFFFFLILIFLSLYAKWNFTNKFNFLRYLFSISNLWSSNFDHLYIARYRLGIILEFIIRGYLSWILGNARRSITREHSITPYHFHKPHFEQSNSTFNQVFPMRLFRFLRTSKSFEQLPLNLRFVGVIKLESAKLWPFKPSRKAVLRRKSTLLDKYFSRRTRLGNKKIGRDREKERRKKRMKKRKIQTMQF